MHSMSWKGVKLLVHTKDCRRVWSGVEFSLQVEATNVGQKMMVGGGTEYK